MTVRCFAYAAVGTCHIDGGLVGTSPIPALIVGHYLPLSRMSPSASSQISPQLNAALRHSTSPITTRLLHHLAVPSRSSGTPYWFGLTKRCSADGNRCAPRSTTTGLHVLLRPEGLRLHLKRVHRPYREEGLQLKPRSRRIAESFSEPT